MTNCLNCGAPVNGKYCHQCGQKAHVNRLTAKALVDEVVHFFTHAEETFFKTTLHFIIKPGITSLNFIEGKRKRYQKPVSYFLIWTGAYILLHNFIINIYHYPLVLQPIGQTLLQEEANIMLRKHFSFFMIPILILSALIIWLILGRPRLLFFELFTIALYGGGTYFALSIFLDFFLGVIFRFNINHYHAFYVNMMMSGIYNLWLTLDFFRRTKIKWLWPRLILTAALLSYIGNEMMLYLPLAWIYITK